MRDRIHFQILQALGQQNTASWARLVDWQDASLPEFHAALEALQAEGRIVIDPKGISLTADGRRAIAALSTEPPLALACAHCESKGYAVAADDDRLLRFDRVLGGRPAANLDFDQGSITSADSLLRAGFVEERGDLCGTRILFVGDFDMTSVALALTGRPARVVVLEIDPRVIDFINEVARREDLRLEARPFDVRDPLPESLCKQFDIFLCDPVETLAGIRLYLSRGCSALAGEGAAVYVGLTTLEASRRKWRDIQGILYEMGFAITDIRRKFSGYPDHDNAPDKSAHVYPIIERMAGQEIGHRWYTSAFIRAEAVRDLRPIITGRSELGEDLYVDDEALGNPAENLVFVWSRQEEDEALVSGLIASQFPDTGINAARVRFLSEGEDYKVFECEGWAWRFPKRSEVESWLLREGPLLEAIGPTLDVPVPRFCLHGTPGSAFPFAFVGYRMLLGTAADHLPDAARPELANGLARFLSALHAFPFNLAGRMGMPDCRCLFNPETYQASVREAYVASARAALPPPLRAACDAFFADPQIPRAPTGEWMRLIHGDLEAEHILLEPLSRRITGVLDWSDACLGDPARDFGALWAWGGDRFLEDLLAAYTCRRDKDFVPRLKFLGRCYSLNHYVASLTERESQITFSLHQLDNVFRD